MLSRRSLDKLFPGSKWETVVELRGQLMVELDVFMEFVLFPLNSEECGISLQTDIASALVVGSSACDWCCSLVA